MKIKFNEERCVGCYACYTACIAEHHSPEEEDACSRRAIRTIIEEGFQKNVCEGCIHCGLCTGKRIMGWFLWIRIDVPDAGLVRRSARRR